jgi:mRNA deadenylase 3'-5' endonuclease subunit Ccr4
MSYNILANCYSDTTYAKEVLFSHCPSDYLKFTYRRILLVHEIISRIFSFIEEEENFLLHLKDQS